jgi:hypothetical protein
MISLTPSQQKLYIYIKRCIEQTCPHCGKAI